MSEDEYGTDRGSLRLDAGRDGSVRTMWLSLDQDSEWNVLLSPAVAVPDGLAGADLEAWAAERFDVTVGDATFDELGELTWTVTAPWLRGLTDRTLPAAQRHRYGLERLGAQV